MSTSTEGMASLFDPPAPPRAVRQRHARPVDPDTSQEAGDLAKEWEGEMCRTILATVVELERRGAEGATAHEIVMRLAYGGEAPQQNSVSRRLTTLTRHGHVTDSGLRRRSGRRGGHPLIVWTATPEGRVWLTEGAA